MAPKRTNGEGSVFRDMERGGWVGLLSIDGRRRKVRARTKTDVLAKLDALKRDAAEGVSVEGNRTVADVLALWEQRDLATRPLGATSRDNYERAVRVLREELGRERLRSLTVERVERGLDRITTGRYGRGELLSRRSVKLVRSTLAQALDLAVNRRWIAFNPARQALLTPTAKPATSRRALTPDEAAALWKTLDGERLGNYFRLMLTTGLRPGEAAGLCWDAVDLDRGVIHVWRAVRRHRGRVELVDYVKTASSYRTIGLPAPAVDVLRAQRRAVAELKLGAKVWAQAGHDLVFPTVSGLPWDPSNVREELTRICAEAGVERITPHELRHSAASILNDQGVPLELIADLLGHVDTTMVSRVYRHRVRPSADAAVEVMGRLFTDTGNR
jgi:integrase